MKRRIALGFAAGLLATVAIAGPVLGDNIFSDQSNPFYFGWQFYGSQYQRQDPIPEPGTTNTSPWQAYSYWASPNQKLP